MSKPNVIFKFRAIIFLAFIAFSVTACVTPVKHDTASGKVEVTINNTSKSNVKNRLTNLMLNRGFSVNRSDDTVISFDKPVDNPMAQMFFGSQYNIIPNSRVVFSLIQLKNSVRVIADLMVVTNPNSQFEKQSSFNNHQDSVSFQKTLDDLKASIEKKK